MRNSPNYQFWTPQEEAIMRQYYSTMPLCQLEELLPNRSRRKILAKAPTMGLKMLYPNQERIQYDISPLLQDSPVAFYWMGFLLADGHFNESNVITVGLALADLNHLQRFANFIKAPHISVGPTSASVATKDARFAPQIRAKFDLRSDKTVSPPRLDYYRALPINLFLALVIGFIDGDGCITRLKGRHVSSAKIKNHKTWQAFQTLITERLGQALTRSLPTSYITRDGYAEINLAHDCLVYLKSALLEMDLPVLSRKWDKVDQTLLARWQKTDIYEKRIIQLTESGATTSQMSQELGIKYASVRRLRLKLFREGRVTVHNDYPSKNRTPLYNDLVLDAERRGLKLD